MVAEVKYLKTGQDRIEKKLDTFIDSADKRYATKNELLAVKKSLDDENARQNNVIKSTGDKFWDVIKMLLPWAMAGIIIILQNKGV